jgi:hypothetical protein
MPDREPTQEPARDERFFHLVMMLATSAMHQLGQLPNPATNQREVDLDGAQLSIDLLEMLQQKTEGRRDEEESRSLNQALTSLRLLYVQAANAPPPAPKAGAEPAAGAAKEAEADPPPAGAPRGAAPKKDGGHEPRFHKSYG